MCCVGTLTKVRKKIKLVQKKVRWIEKVKGTVKQKQTLSSQIKKPPEKHKKKKPQQHKHKKQKKKKRK